MKDYTYICKSLNSNKTQINSFLPIFMPCYFYYFLLKKSLSRFNCLKIFHLQDKFRLLLMCFSIVSVVYVFSNWLYSSKQKPGNSDISNLWKSLFFLATEISFETHFFWNFEIWSREIRFSKHFVVSVYLNWLYGSERKPEQRRNFLNLWTL